MTSTIEATVLSGWRQRELILAGKLCVVDLIRATLERIDEIDSALHSFTHVAHDDALRQAHDLDRALEEGASPGPLFGVPVSIKDLFHVRGMPTSAGSLIFQNQVADTDSIHAMRLRDAGAVLVGKTNTPEFGLFPRTTNRVQPETVNPHDHARTCGGSSGGAAASVAAGLTPLAVGSDGGGSIRIPAALCGVAGILPTRGLVPRHGGVGGTLLFSQAGPLASDLRDLATLLQVMAGPFAEDPLAHTTPAPDLLSDLDRSISGVRLRWLPDTGVATPRPDVLEAVEQVVRGLTVAGAELDPKPAVVDAEQWVTPFYSMMGADRYASMGERVYEDPQTRPLLSEYGETHFARALNVTAVQYSRALETRYRVRQQLMEAMTGFDLLASPTVGTIAPRIDEPIDRLPLVAFTFFCNYAGFPAATIPCGLVDGLPVGLQLIGRPGADAMILQTCRAIEQTLVPT